MNTSELVSEYQPVGTPADVLLSYPFARPDTSFVTNGEKVHQLPDNYEQFCSATNAFLAEQGLPLLEDRIPVVAYGANVNPRRFQEKMLKFDTQETNLSARADIQTVPMISAKIKGSQVVWHGRTGQAGSVFAELLKDDTTKDMEADCFVQFLTPVQLAMMHTTEGDTYHMVKTAVEAGDAGQQISAFAYVAGSSFTLQKDGEPVAVAIQGRDGGPGVSMGAEEAVNYMVELAGDTIGVQSARELIDLNKDTPLALRKQRQAQIAQKLATIGASKKFSHPATKNAIYGRAVISSLLAHTDHAEHGKTAGPVNVSLMEADVASIRPSQDFLDTKASQVIKPGEDLEVTLERVRRTTDIAAVLRAKATLEIEQRLDAA